MSIAMLQLDLPLRVLGVFLFSLFEHISPCRWMKCPQNFSHFNDSLNWKLIIILDGLGGILSPWILGWLASALQLSLISFRTTSLGRIIALIWMGGFCLNPSFRQKGHTQGKVTPTLLYYRKGCWEVSTFRGGPPLFQRMGSTHPWEVHECPNKAKSRPILLS